MQIFPEGYTVAYSVPLEDLNGNSVTATSVVVTVSDERNASKGSLTLVPPDGATKIEFEVASAWNVPAEDALGYEGRFVTVEILTAAGSISRRFSYVIQTLDVLEAPTNSFQTFEQALLTAFRIPHLAEFQAAATIERQTALMEAFQRIIRISLKVLETPVDLLDRPVDSRFARYQYLRQTDWAYLTAASFEAFPSYFREALKRAQVIEANAILANDPVAQKRRQGILSESIGESSMMFRNGFIDLGVADRTLEQLTGLVHYDFRVTR